MLVLLQVQLQLLLLPLQTLLLSVLSVSRVSHISHGSARLSPYLCCCLSSPALVRTPGNLGQAEEHLQLPDWLGGGGLYSGISRSTVPDWALQTAPQNDHTPPSGEHPGQEQRWCKASLTEEDRRHAGAGLRPWSRRLVPR